MRGISLTQDFRELLLEKGFISSYNEEVNSSFFIDLGNTSPSILISYYYREELLNKNVHDLYLESLVKRLNVNNRLYHLEFCVSRNQPDIDITGDFVKVYYECVCHEKESVQVFGKCERYHRGNRLILTNSGKFEVNGSTSIEKELDWFIGNRCNLNGNKVKMIGSGYIFIQVRDSREDAEELLDQLVNLSYKTYDNIDIATSYNKEHADTIGKINCLGFAYGIDAWVKPPFASLNLENYWNNVAFLYDFSKDKEIQKTIVQVLEETLRGYDSTIYCRVIDSIIELGQNETLTLLYVEEGGVEYHAIKYLDGHWLHKLGDDFVYYIPTDMNPLETNTWASSADYYSCDAMPIMVATGHNQVSSFN